MKPPQNLIRILFPLVVLVAGIASLGTRGAHQ